MPNNPCICPGYRYLENLASRKSPGRVIINADDLGQSVGINNAIMQFAATRAISSASLLIVGAASEEAARWASQQRTISVGIHLCLSDSLLPITTARGLTGKGERFFSFSHLAKRAFTSVLPLDAVKIEWQAQIDRIRSYGINPTHIDSHQHVHLLPGLQDVFLEIAKVEGLPVRHTAGPFGWSFVGCWPCGHFWYTILSVGVWKSALLRRLGLHMRQQLERSGIPIVNSYISPSSLCSRYRHIVSDKTGAMLARLASTCSGNIEWVVHPNASEPVVGEASWMANMRTGDTQQLKCNRYMHELAKMHVTTINFENLRNR